jgi:hypothetical protein
LKAPDERVKTLCVGDGKYDPQNVGFQTYPAQVANCPPRTSLFDTTPAGNRNIGHDFGTKLSPAEKRQLIEYLKTL